MKLASLFVGCLALVAMAQAAPESFAFKTSDISLLLIKDIQTELKVTTAQRDKMNAAQALHKNRLIGYQKEITAKGQDPTKVPANDPKLKQYMVLFRKNVLDVLSPVQLQRLSELTIQSNGLKGLLDDNVAAKVGIGAAQLKSMRTIFANGYQKANVLRREALNKALTPFNGTPMQTEQQKKDLAAKQQVAVKREMDKVKPQMLAIEKDTEKQLNAKVTAAQRTAWVKLQGKKFTPKA